MSPSLSLRGRSLAVYVFCCVVWGSTWLIIRVGVRDVPPLRLAALRMALACLVLVPLALRAQARVRPTAAEWAGVAWAGFLQIGVAYAAIFFAATRIESGLSAVLFGAFPIWVALLAHVLLPDEPLTLRTGAAALVGLAGVAIIEGPAALQGITGRSESVWVGGLLVFASSLVSAYSNIYVKKRLGRVSPVVNVWGQTFVGSIALFAATFLFERGQPAHWTPSAIGSLLYLAIPGTVLTFIALYWLVPRVPMSVIGTIPLVDTVIAVILGAIILGESLPLRVFAGGALILVGVVLATIAPQSPNRGATPAKR
ncbi:MAG: EamA family transporter [Acidobacteriota bacterium]